MAVPVAVVDPLPMFRRGVVAVLSAAGYAVDDPEDVVAWADQPSAAVVLLTLNADQDWQLLGQLQRSRTTVVALVDDGDAVTAARALQAGARSVLSRQVTAAVLCRTIEATLDGQAVLPSDAAAVLAAGEAISVATGEAMPSEEQRTWLRRLASGTTVARLADDAGYSERAMYRLLQSLYEQMGVDGRTQAIIRAQVRGWLR